MNEQSKDAFEARHTYVRELVNEIAPNVWLRLSGNGSLRMDIDTDVECYGEWAPDKPPEPYDRVVDAQFWVEYFVRSTINKLVTMDLLNVPGQDKEQRRL